MNGRTNLLLSALAAAALSSVFACDSEVVVAQNDPSCQSDEDCPDGICLRGACIDGECTKDADCGPLPPACGDSDTMLLRPIGECDDSYHCNYTPVEEDCPDWGCNFDTGQCFGPPCEGVVCQTPRNECFMANGSCNGGNCEYPLRNGVTCDDSNLCTTGDSCDEGVCAGTPIACDTPPTNYCVDADNLFQYRAQGVCNDRGDCDYQFDVLSCPFGCDSSGSVAVCRADPCGSSACDQPPADYCLDADHVRLHLDLGTCNNGLCDYPTNDVFCAFGCYQGACKPDPCEGVVCDTPPPPTCVDDHTRKSFSLTATCVNGNCPYLSSNMSCQHGCLNGLCQGDPCLGTDCDDGNPCTADSCDSANSGVCRHVAANDGGACVAPSGSCPQGTCGGGVCLSTPNVTCMASVPFDMCMDMDVPGTCTAAGQCVPLQSQGVQCTIPCNGICIQCFIFQFCFEF